MCLRFDFLIAMAFRPWSNNGDRNRALAQINDYNGFS